MLWLVERWAESPGIRRTLERSYNGAKKGKHIPYALDLKFVEIKVFDFFFRFQLFTINNWDTKLFLGNSTIRDVAPNVLICVSHLNRNMYLKCVSKENDHIQIKVTTRPFPWPKKQQSSSLLVAPWARSIQKSPQPSFAYLLRYFCVKLKENSWKGHNGVV